MTLTYDILGNNCISALTPNCPWGMRLLYFYSDPNLFVHVSHALMPRAAIGQTASTRSPRIAYI